MTTWCTPRQTNMLAWLDGDWPGREPGSRPRDIGYATHQGLERYCGCATREQPEPVTATPATDP